MGGRHIGAGLASLLAAIVVGALTPSGSAPAAPVPFAPLNQPGPPLGVSPALLAGSLTCSAKVTGRSAHDTVLLVPGTALNPTANYSWNYERGFSALGLPWCAVTLPDDSMGSIAVAGEYVVYALRTISTETGRRVDILGYSQGGMVPRWALRFWPDTRPLVQTFVAIDPSNHGTLDADYCDVARSCPAAFWQQAAGSEFLAALNSDAETFAGIDYTVIYSRTDEVVVPNFDDEGSSALHTGAGAIENIAVQSICPTDTSDHLEMGTVDPVAYALAVDAFEHESLADPAQIPPSVCTEGLSPAVDRATFVADFAGFLGTIATSIATAPEVTSAPPLPAYVYPAG